MRNLILIIASLITFIIDCKSQIINYFDNNPIWTIISSDASNQPCYVDNVFNYYLNGDTILNSNTYYKVFKKGTKYFTWLDPHGNPCPSYCMNDYSYINSIPFAFIRQVNKKDSS